MTVTDAMVVAGGHGRRLEPLTDDRPKPLVPFVGQPFLLGVIHRLAAVGVARVFLVVGADPTPFDVLTAPAAALGVTLEAVPEPEPLDTAGGVRSVIERVDGPVFVLNGDVLTDLDLAALVRHHHDHDADVTIALTLVDDTSTYGVCVREGSRIVDFVEKPPPGTLPGQHGVNAGTYLLQPDVLDGFPTGPLSFERTVFPAILTAGGHVQGFAWDGVWADLGTPARYRRGHRLVLAGRLDWPGLEVADDRGDGVRVAPGARVDGALVGPSLVLAGATVAEGAVVGPDVVIGRDAVVGPDVHLADSVLLDGARIGAGIRAEGLVAGAGASVEAGARLGHGVMLGDGAVVAADAVVADDERVRR